MVKVVSTEFLGDFYDDIIEGDMLISPEESERAERAKKRNSNKLGNLPVENQGSVEEPPRRKKNNDKLFSKKRGK